MKRRFFNWLQRIFKTAGEEKSTRGHVLNATLSAEPKERNTTRVKDDQHDVTLDNTKAFSFNKTIPTIIGSEHQIGKNPIPIPEDKAYASSTVKAIDVSGLTEHKESWMYRYLHKKQDYVSPTELAKEYGLFSRGKAYGTSTSHRVLISLWEKGLVTKNEKGHYKAIC